MVSKFAPKRKSKLIQINEIDEELRLIDVTYDYYITPSGKVYRKYPDGYYPRNDFTAKSGYVYITIVTKTGNKKSFRLHRLVATAYISNPDNLPIVGHKDNIKTNNNVSNLYWTTNSENIQKAVDDKLLLNDKGYEDSQSYPIIVLDNNYQEIERYGSVTECHKALGISKSTILRHCNNQIKGKSRTGFYFKFQNT